VRKWWRQRGRKAAPKHGSVLGRVVRFVRGWYDAARTTDENRRHWAAADNLSARAANSLEVRRTLRARARYEVGNNSYAKGIVKTLANFVVGTGPRLQLLTDDEATNRLIEREFGRWAKAVGLAHKLRTMRMAQCETGEVFAIQVTNPNVDAPVKLDLKVIEADYVTTPWSVKTRLDDEKMVDGIEFDAYQNPAKYYVLRYHPGDGPSWSGSKPDHDELEAKDVSHLFWVDRPGQVRGIPEITSSVSLFAVLRRYTLAVLGAAEQAALPGGVVHTDSAADPDENVEPMDQIELDRGTWLTMPLGWRISQVKAEQPTTTYGDFKHEVINESARCLDMPYNVAAGNSSGYNYASGRLDHQSFFKAIRIDQNHLDDVVLDRIFIWWLNEAVLIEGYLPQWVRQIGVYLPRQWFWDGSEHVDPAKEANAQGTRLANHTTTLAAEYAKQGLDWEKELRQRARELKLMRKLGLVPADVPAPSGADDDAADEDEEEDEESESAARTAVAV